MIKDALACAAMQSSAALSACAHQPLGTVKLSTALKEQGSHTRLWCAIGMLAVMLAACVLLLLYVVTDVAVQAGVVDGSSCWSSTPGGWGAAHAGQQHSLQGLLPQPDVDFVLV